MKNYKYELEKGSKHVTCPNCRRKTFKCYVSVSDGKTRADETKYGRCERINACAYQQYPPSEESDYQEWTPIEYIPEPKREPDFIPRGTVEKTFSQFNNNTFMIYLREMFGTDKALELQSTYNIGTASNHGTIYWQQDKDGNFRTGKIMYYGKDGRRLKNKNSWYLHKRVNPDFELEQVFFGEHLISEDRPIALVESERSAVLMSVFMPDYIWLASGGSQMLNNDRLSRLPRLDLVCADNGEFESWQRATKHFNRQMDVSVDRAVAEGILKIGDDILDLYLLNSLAETV